jgi:hypothetical protein
VNRDIRKLPNKRSVKNEVQKESPKQDENNTELGIGASRLGGLLEETGDRRPGLASGESIGDVG